MNQLTTYLCLFEWLVLFIMSDEETGEEGVAALTSEEIEYCSGMLG
jgi:hypothetical protein